eukprot:410953_1
MNKFDLNIFRADDLNDLECTCNGKDYTQCQSMERLLAGLKYYSMLKITSNENDKELWNQFINEIYYNLIDDYIHFNNNHSHEIENINTQITNKKSVFDPCDISQCAFTSRHHNQISQTDKNILTPTEHFWKRTMDSLHFYLFHCFHVGIRLKKEEKIQATDANEEKKDEYFDSAFSRVNKMILERQHITKEFDRFSLKKIINLIFK